MNVEKMRRYHQRGVEVAEEQTIAREWQRKLTAMTPEHRARHESDLIVRAGFCNECFQASLQPFARMVKRMEERRKAREAAQRES